MLAGLIEIDAESIEDGWEGGVGVSCLPSMLLD
jgi:hypothetical protein